MKDVTVTRQAVETGSTESSQGGNELYKVGVTTTAILAGAVGVWSLICLASAILNEGGPLNLIKSFLTAING